ncbi:hypothetical protein ACFOOK_26440 [Micromonospora krabiensis]|uniref:Uncharacterized protein n=1 Tax=Micromonospora krabiensis TaxID=307121 RepID=A0A1C3N5R1_9ACTN|nr:hypothetical protein [Micromonospora krabiensis]SBV27893.1 hypothetical protein GA0070620_3424 [Micromonospora krabiensis]
MSTDALLEEGDLRVRLEYDEFFGDIRAYQDGLPHELRTFDPYSYGRDRRDAREVGGPLFDDWAWMLRRSQWREDPEGWATKVIRRWVQMQGGVSDIVGRRLFYLLPEDAGNTDPDLLKRQLDGGIAEIHAWENGEVYGYVVERLTEWVQKDKPSETRTTWESEDSCGGYIGYEHAVEAATEAFEYAKL